MRNKFTTGKQDFVRWISLLALLCCISGTYCRERISTVGTTEQATEKNYLGTTVFILSSFIPDDNTFFFELDYGRKLSAHTDLVVGFDVYKYTAPMSAGWRDDVSYPGHVLSYGAVFAFQKYVYRQFFIDLIVNPLVMNYYSDEGRGVSTGFMLLFALRSGYHHDFSLYGRPFYIELGAEISYWPVNTNVPPDFRAIDGKYTHCTPSPVFQFGYRF